MSTAARPTPAAEERDVARALGRAAVYRILGRAFGYPRPSELAGLAREAEIVADAPWTAPGIREPLRAFETAAREADPAAVADEHVFLFDRQARCPPHEGAYGDAPRMAGKGAQLADIAGFYAAFGLAPSAAQPETEDHIAAELEFMSALALKEAYALAEGLADGLEVTRRAQKAFVGDHLGCWAGVFADALIAASPLPYYGRLGGLLAAWTGAEVESLGVAPSRRSGRLPDDPAQEDAFTCPMVEGEPSRRPEVPGPPPAPVDEGRAQ